MEETLSISTLMESTTSKIHQLRKAFTELENHQAITLNLKWKELEQHFHGLEKSLKRRFDELEEQEREYKTKTMEACLMLEKREAAVVAKEEATLEKLQEKRDASLCIIASALEKHRKISFLEVPSPQSSVVTCEDIGGAPIVEEKSADAIYAGDETNSEDVKGSSENGHLKVTSYPQLTELCGNMDSEGLHNFISDNRKNLAALREEIPIALMAATNPALLVLDSLQDFYRFDVTNLDGKKDPNLLGLRRTCIMLMECLSTLLTSLDAGSASNIISELVKEQAKSIARKWRPKLDMLDMDSSNGNSLEVHAFLQLLATYGIASDFDQEEICRLIPMVSRRRQTPDLCHRFGLSARMPGVIETLVNSGRKIDAVNLAFAFDLTEQFSPVHLLKSYLKDARKVSSPVKSGNALPAWQNEASERELSALKTVMKCIEGHRLESKFPIEPIQKRVLQLEKAKADKKRVTEPSKPQSKRPRASCGGHGPHIASEKAFYTRVADRYPQFLYERPYVYPGHAESHNLPFLGPATYNLSAGRGGNFFSNGYQYQGGSVYPLAM